MLRENSREMNEEKWTETRLRKARENLQKKAEMSKWEADGRDYKRENVMELWRNKLMEVERRVREKSFEDLAYKEEYRR